MSCKQIYMDFIPHEKEMAFCKFFLNFKIPLLVLCILLMMLMRILCPRVGQTFTFFYEKESKLRNREDDIN